ncbi:hypothetical protein NP233_g5008 [Leucocoprinus birnbaumii]|uniref:Extracellular serine-rich protein n=1 Tax=Leucocoprinus birnbaumii TaxID=56174 RepID=A0AAD5VU47_9AGAR|nr:hypothetical protein NP233_g5008 [Leucocoprinus birnbaumii]
MQPLTTIATFILASSSVLATEFLVGVGMNETTGQKGVGFDPSVILPVVGDNVRFEFRSGTHSAVQTTFDTPCVPLPGGYNSGVFTVDDSAAVDAPNLPSVLFMINDTIPMWFFDQASGNCQQGAVLAINPSTSQTADQFRANAAKSPVAPMSTSTESSPTSSGSAAGASGSSGNNGAAGVVVTRASVSGAVGVTVGALAAAFWL